MKCRLRRRRSLSRTVLLAPLLVITAMGVGGPAYAGDGEWTLRLEAISMEAYGHDQHVLTIHEIDLDEMPQIHNSTAVNLETDSSLAYRGEFRYTGTSWGWGLDFFWFSTSQGGADRTGAADGPSGTFDQVAFQIAGRQYVSSDPGETLYYSVLEDTDIALWTLDLYGVRTLAERQDSALHLMFGLRMGDFDNDYRAVVGVEGIVGSRVDASSNYDRMMGLLLGLSGDISLGRSSIRGSIAQSVLLGSVELTRHLREFSGPFSEEPPFVDHRVFRAERDVAIPITEIRIDWTYRATRFLSVGVGVNTAAWWDVPVPPGAIPTEGDGDTLHENSIVLVGLLGAVVLTF